MDQGLKERLVGAAVLVAIAVWLIPWVLDGPEGAARNERAARLQLPAAEEPMPMRTQTLRLGDAAEPSVGAGDAAVQPLVAEPARHEAPPAESTAETPSAPSEAPAVAAVRPEPERTAPAASPPATAPKPPPKPAPAAAATGDWTVQLGSFSEEANARRLAQRVGHVRLQGRGLELSKSDGRTLYRVRVGPARSRAEADATASALKAHGVDARVVAAR